ncbi:hypothetical protein BJV74DRAFT_888755 [Russula compacta]|nr:hypothetical protein BJV74DRAFT_888755 [Russula compacta]
MAESARRVTTHATNADTHPGLTVGGRKRRSKAQIEADNAEKAAKEAAKQLETQQLLQRIADLESQLHPGNMDNATPQPGLFQSRQKTLNKTKDSSALTSDADQEMGNDIDIVTKSQRDLAEESATEDQPPKKKQKKEKPSKTVVEGGGESAGGKATDKGSKVADVATSGVKAPNTCKLTGFVHMWASGVKPGAPSKPTSRASSHTSTTLAAQAVSSATSALSNVVLISSSRGHQKPGPVIKEEPGLDHKSSKGEEKGDERGAFYTSILINIFLIHYFRMQDIIKVKEMPAKERTHTATRKHKDLKLLPQGATDDNKFRGRFTPTFISWVAEHGDAWWLDKEKAIDAMQKSWNAIYGKKVPYTITTDSEVYSKTEQHLRDGWRNAIGTAAITSEFATGILKDCGFLYSEITGDKPDKWKGLFRSQFIVEMVACHFLAINGAVKVKALNLDSSNPRNMLAMAGAAVQQAFMMWLDGVLTIENSGNGSKVPKLARTINRLTGKESTHEHAFSETNWGDITRKFHKTIDKSLRQKTIETIIERVKKYLQESRKKASQSVMAVIDVDSDHKFIDISD